jgi:hypothetical protein
MSVSVHFAGHRVSKVSSFTTEPNGLPWVVYQDRCGHQVSVCTVRSTTDRRGKPVAERRREARELIDHQYHRGWR